MHQNCNIEEKRTNHVSNRNFGALFELALLVQIRTNTLHQDCVCEENQSRASELLQTLFCTKNGPTA